MTPIEIDHEKRICALEGYELILPGSNTERPDNAEYKFHDGWAPLEGRNWTEKDVHPALYRRKIQPEPPQLDAGPGATVRSYRKLGEEDVLQKGDIFMELMFEHVTPVSSFDFGKKVKDFPTLDFRRPIDSPAHDTPQLPEEKPLIVEAGKRYKRKDGKISGKIGLNQASTSKDYRFVDLTSGYTYTEQGKWKVYGGERNLDLVSEYVEPEEEATSQGAIKAMETWMDVNDEANGGLDDFRKASKQIAEVLSESEPSPGEGWRWLKKEPCKENDEYSVPLTEKWRPVTSRMIGYVPGDFEVRRNLAYEGLDQLPDGYREAAKANWDREFEPVRFSEDPTLDAIWNFTNWDKTTEGYIFWNGVSVALHNKNTLPPLPLYSIVNGKLTCPTDGTGTTREQAIADNVTRLETELEAARKIK